MGRPRGAWGEKPFRDALRVALNAPSKEDGRKELEHIVDGLVSSAKAKEPWAVQECINRLDGRPPQDINVESTVTHELAGLSDPELAALIQSEVARLAGGGEEPKDKERLH